MNQRDEFPRLSARNVRDGDAGHRKADAGPTENLGKPPFRSSRYPVEGRRESLAMHRIDRDFCPVRGDAERIFTDHYPRSLA